MPAKAEEIRLAAGLSFGQEAHSSDLKRFALCSSIRVWRTGFKAPWCRPSDREEGFNRGWAKCSASDEDDEVMLGNRSPSQASAAALPAS